MTTMPAQGLANSIPRQTIPRATAQRERPQVASAYFFCAIPSILARLKVPFAPHPASPVGTLGRNRS